MRVLRSAGEVHESVTETSDSTCRTTGATTPTASAPGRPCVGLALGGGAAFGGMHVGVIMALHESGIPIDVVAGTSAGAFVGAFLAGGMLPDEMARLAMRLRWSDLRRHLLSVRSLMSNDRMAAWLRRYLPETEFDAMPMPFAAVATDLLQGTMVVLSAAADLARMQARAAERERSTGPDGDGKDDGDSGRLNDLVRRVAWQTAPVPVAVAASSAIPVIFEPVRVGSRLLIDGGISAMVPASVARWLGADVVIGVDILPPRQVFTPPRTIVEYAIQAHRVGTQWAVRNRSINADFILRPRAVNGRWNDMRNMAELISLGRAEALAALPRIRRALGGATCGTATAGVAAASAS